MKKAFQETTTRLTEQFGAAEARSLSRILFEDSLHWKPGMNDRDISIIEQQLLASQLERLEAGEPVQYITGISYFYDLCLSVSPAVLIPRPETEELVEWVLETNHKWERESIKITVLDIGTGSGCIPLALKHVAPYFDVTGMDVSSAALEVAKNNAEELELEVAFLPVDILDEKQWNKDWSFAIIISNPPYIPQKERSLMSEKVLSHEPELALFVENKDPLIFYRKILEFAERHLRKPGYLFFECNEFNAPEVVQLCHDFKYTEVILKKDLQGKDRMIRARKSED